MSVLEYLKEYIVNERRQRGAKTGKVTMIHGTSDKFLKSILVNGLLPTTKEKVWSGDDESSFNVPSRKSYGGVYLSNNLLTAISSSRNAVKNLGGSDPLIVICEIQPRSALPDEDNVQSHVTFALQSAIGGRKFTPNEHYYSVAYASYVAKDDEYKDHLKYFVMDLSKALSDNEKQTEMTMKTPETIDAIQKLYDATLLRKMAHIDIDTQKYALARYFTDKTYEELDQYVFTDKAKAEEDYIDKLNRVISIFKRRAYNSMDRREYTNHTLRIMEPIKFSGANKIIGIIQLEDYFKRGRMDYPITQPIVIRYGTLPNELVEEYRQKIGSQYEIVDRSRQNVNTEIA